MPVVAEWERTDRGRDWRDEEFSASRQADVAEEIADDPVSVALIRSGVRQAAQTVRLLTPAKGRELGSSGGEEARAELVVLGDADFDVQREDRFAVGSQWYRVIYVAPEQPDRVEAGAVQMQ